MDAQRKLELLADAGRYDLACSCGTRDPAEHRKRTVDGSAWLYPVSLAAGGRGLMLKTLLSSACVNDCRYCPLRAGSDAFRRCTLGADETARLFLEHDRRRRLLGLFLSSGVLRDPDNTMTRLNAVAAILRKKYRYRGYIHLKVIPGASEAAIEEAVSLASAVSVNIETPDAECFAPLSRRKDWTRDILRPMRAIRRAILGGGRRVRQTTQFLVGAAGESDRAILDRAGWLYRDLKLDRIYFSAYQNAVGAVPSPDACGGDLENPETVRAEARKRLVREHRLYQSEFLMRKYGFDAGEIPLDALGFLDPGRDPKQAWADAHPEAFPVKIGTASPLELLRVPGLGPVTVKRLVAARGTSILRSVADIKLPPKRAALASRYLAFA